MLVLLRPRRIPDLSFKLEKINGKVAGIDELNIFLLDIPFIICELCDIGKELLKISSSLKYDFLEYNPEIPQMFSSFNIEALSFSGDVSETVRYVWKLKSSSLFTCNSFLIYFASLYENATRSISWEFWKLSFRLAPEFVIK